MSIFTDGKPHSNSVFWDSQCISDSYRFLSWERIKSCYGIGYAERTIFIYFKDDSYKESYTYKDRETMFKHLERLMTEMKLYFDKPRDDNILEMKEKLDHLYYAPGMPGYVEAQKDFYVQMDKQI